MKSGFETRFRKNMDELMTSVVGENCELKFSNRRPILEHVRIIFAYENDSFSIMIGQYGIAIFVYDICSRIGPQFVYRMRAKYSVVCTTWAEKS